MTNGDFTGEPAAHPRTAAFQRAGHQAVKPVRDLRARTGEAVPYDIGHRRVLIDPRTLTYWIPFVAGLGVMIGGMKTAGSPFLGVPQLIVGIALIALAAWDYVSDSGVLPFASTAPAPATGFPPLLTPPPPLAPRVDDVRPTGSPLAPPPPLPPRTRLQEPPPPAPPAPAPPVVASPPPLPPDAVSKPVAEHDKAQTRELIRTFGLEAPGSKPLTPTPVAGTLRTPVR